LRVDTQEALMKTEWLAAWRGMDLLVLRNGVEVDRVHADDIERVILVDDGPGETPGELLFAVIETAVEHLLLPAQSGIAGCVHFERQAFWAARDCIYWVNAQHLTLPRRLRPGIWPLRRAVPDYLRLPRAELAQHLEHWPLEGPQTWEQRKWERIARSRLLGPAHRPMQPPPSSGRGGPGL
jgi:hypothetical protein